jgi:hypothetical protein
MNMSLSVCNPIDFLYDADEQAKDNTLASLLGIVKSKFNGVKRQPLTAFQT